MAELVAGGAFGWFSPASYLTFGVGLGDKPYLGYTLSIANACEYRDMSLLQIIYTSHAAVQLDKEARQRLVADANRRNRENAITGVLYCSENAYMQVLEGNDRDVLPIYADILRDDRHDHIRTVAIRPIEERDFAAWNMGLIEDLNEPIDLSHVLNRRDDRVGVWNDAAWPTILNTFRAELGSTDP